MRSVGRPRFGWGENMRRALSAAAAVLLGASVLTFGALPAVAGPGPSIDSSPTNATTATPLEWTFSNASPASCELTEGATQISALADCVSPADYDVSADAGGTYTFTVYAAAAADVVVGTTPSATSAVDVAPLAPTITSSPTTPDNDATPSWSFTLPSGATATCELDDPANNAVDTDSNCSSPFTASDLNNAPANGANGLYTFSVTPTAGGVTGAAATSTYTFDTVAPPAPTVSSDAGTGFSLHPTFTVSGLVAGATLDCSVSGPGGGPAVTVETCGAASELDLTGGSDGSYTLHVTQTKAGNISADGTASYLLDTHVPATPTVTPPTSPGTDASPTFAISGVESGGTPVCTVTGPSTVPDPTCGSSTTLDLSSAAEGTYTLTVTVQDAAGMDSAPASATYEFEAGGPATPVVTAPSSPGRSRVPSFGVTDSDPVGLTYDCTVTGPSDVTTSACGSTSTLDLAGADDGTYVLSVVATDGLGQSSQAGTASYTLDTTPPPAPTVTAPSSPSSNTSPSFTINESEPGTTLTCSVSGQSSFPIPAADCASGLVVNLAGSNRDGVYTLTVTATDAAGNVSDAGSASYTLDTTPPPVPTIVAPPSPSNDLTPSFTIGDAEVGATLTCAFVDPSNNVVFSGTCPADGTFDTTSDTVDGQYRLTVTATDEAGNQSSASASWTRDTTPPPVPNVSVPPSPSNDLAPTFGISDSESDATFGCVLTSPTSVNVFSGACPANGIFTVAGFGDGPYSLAVTATDPTGNTSAPRVVSYVLDTTPPPAPSVNLLAPLLSTSNVTSPQFTVSDTQPGVSYVCSVTGVTPVPPSAITCGATTTVNLSGLGRDGDYTLSVSAVDVAGNISAPGTITYTLDTTAPPNPTVVAPPSPSKDLTPTFAISDTESDVVLGCVLTGPGNTIAFSNLCPPDGTFDLTGFGDGTYVLSVTATDPAGNVAATNTAQYVLDTTPPPVPSVSLTTPATSPGNVTAPQFAVSDGEPGVTYSCAVTGPTTVPASAISCGATTTLDLSGAGRDGKYTLSVTATDSAGNTSAAGMASYRLDTTPPPVPVVTLSVPATSPGNVTAPQFAVTDANLGPVTYSCSVLGATPVPNAAITCGATTTVDLSGPGRDGSYTLSVTATDVAGNTSAPSTATYVLDTTPPPVPVVSLAVPASSPGNVTSPQFTVTDTEAGDTYSCAVTGPTTVPGSAITCGATTTVDLSGAGRDGTYTLSVVAIDAAGNTSAAGTALYTLDTTPPPRPIIMLSSPASSPSNDAEPSWTVSDTNASPVTFSCTVTGPTVVPGSAITCGTTTTVDLSGAGRDGTYILSIKATDSAGNLSSARTATYILDTTPPPVPGVLLSVPPSSPGNVTSPQFAVTDTDPGPGGPAVTYACSVTGATPVPGSAITCGATTTVNLSGAGRDGSYTLSVTATDVAGNTSAAGTATYILDTTPPPTPVVALSVPTSSPGNVTSPQFTVTDTEAGVAYSCSVTGPTTVPGTAINCGATTTVNLSGTGRDGTYTVSVAAIDAAGNLSAAGTATYTLDTTPPPKPSIVLSFPTSSPSNVAQPSFAVSDTDPTPVTYTCTVTGPTIVPGSAIVCGAMTTVNLSGAGRDGVYTLSVKATDVAGNTGAARTATYVLDTTAPPVPAVVLSVPPSSPGNVTSPQFTVTDTDPGPGGPGVTYACSVVGATPVPNSAINCGATTTVNLSGFGRDGSYTLSVTATDVAGNTSGPGTATYVLDTTAPPAPVVVVPGSSTLTPVFGISDGDPTAVLTCLFTSPRGKTVFPINPPATCPVSGMFDTTGFAEGTYTLVVTATDPAGNSTSTTVTWLRDTTPPPVPAVSLAVPSSSPGNVTQPQFTVTDSDPGPGGPGVTYACTVSGATAVPSSAITCGATTTVDLSGAGRDGSYTLSVTATDAAGNTSAAGTASYTLDTTPPPAPTVTLATPSSSPSNVTTPQFAVADTEAGVALSCAVTGPTNVPSSAISCGSTTTVNLNGTGRDGVYTLSVTAIDVAGNASTSTGTATYTLDTTPPPAPTVALSTPASSPGNVTSPQFSVTDTESGVTYSCTVTGVTAVLSSAITCGATTSVDLSGAGRDGAYTLSVTATDVAGNTSSAGTTTYTLDTTAPAAPVVGLASATRSSSKTPLWTWQFGFNDQSTDLDVATCTVAGPHGWTSTTWNCAHHFTTSLDGGDGTYTLTVTLTDEAGNTAFGVSPIYTLDSTAPAGPTVFLSHPSGGAGLDRHPVWSVSGPPATTLMCTLRRGGDHGAVVSAEAVCPNPTTFSLVGMPDGLYTLEVVAVDAAQNTSFPAWSSYALVPSAPRVRPPGSQSSTAVWAVSGNPRDTFLCTLTLGNRVVSGSRVCGSHPTYDMTQLPSGTYTLSVIQVVQVNAERVRSAPGSADWFWPGVPIRHPVVPPGGSGHHPGHQPPTFKQPSNPNPLTRIPTSIRKHISKLGHALSSLPIPILHPNGVTAAVQSVVHAVGQAGGGTGFPLLLVGLVMVFLLVQNRIDRRDPKLALASIAADDTVEFHPPPSRRDRP
jgi:hypothetical protein